MTTFICGFNVFFFFNFALIRKKGIENYTFNGKAYKNFRSIQGYKAVGIGMNLAVGATRTGLSKQTLPGE